jgi:hypothetical protein
LLAGRLREVGRRGSKLLCGEGGSADEVAASKFLEGYVKNYFGSEVLTKTNLQL